MASFRSLMTDTIKIGGSDLSGKRFVTYDGLYPTAGGDAWGVLLFDSEANSQDATVILFGAAPVDVGEGGLSAGDYVASDASGKAVTATTGDHILGRVKRAYSTGDVATVYLFAHPTA
ncbi:DUF2190 family protein [bacterium]|nr:DUF2190 family protein [bacterium]